MVDFAETIEDCRLLDPGFDGSEYTWAKNGLFEREGFRFQNMWTRHEGFLDLVREVWAQTLDAHGLLGFQIKLAKVKQSLKWWNKEVFGNIHANIKIMDEEIAAAQAWFEEDLSPANRMLINKHIASYILFLKMEEDFWRQKAAMRWLVEEDKNTKIYQSWVRQKRIRLRIHKVQVDGRELTDDLEIKNSAVTFFKNLLALDAPALVEMDPNLIQPLPSSAHLEALSDLPDAEEVKRVVFDMSGDSTPGPDGFSAIFYQSCWSIIGSDVVAAVQQKKKERYFRLVKENQKSKPQR
ncbi:uncharacterized protein LOC125189815 [Salvia hispanica]|uniref:uncharacterized protein LOC125189815 n=1 Tax=Salvia hispanica TaxID=49212 RepID=UPI002009C5F8|nr:uncharacterized protein LOC125189815 [Salvia hispanica]